MSNNDALFLEEPPTEEFSLMLQNRISVSEYLLNSDAEYPEFTAAMCSALREFHAQGKKIIQIEPYLENLLELHSFLAEGNKPEDLDKNTIAFLVYLMEKNATGALISYYQAAAGASFDRIVEAVKRFARVDAERFRLRDSLRAQALSFYISNFESSYVEAGLMHIKLHRLLQRQKLKNERVKAIFLAEQVLRNLGQKRHLYSPGDQLTLRYVFNPYISDNDRESLLAARSLIYSKIIHKEEMNVNAVAYPHIHDELLCINVTRGLSAEDCRLLFDQIRRASTIDSRQIVVDYFIWLNPEASQNLKKWSTNPSEREVFNEQIVHTF
jgi:hypothetical protein